MKRIESSLQQACVKWFRYQHPKLSKMLFAVPNGGVRSGIEAKIMNGEGVIAGVSDLILLVARKGYGSLCIEMKRPGGKQTANQISWQQETESAGNKYVVCDNVEQFVSEVNAYLN